MKKLYVLSFVLLVCSMVLKAQRSPEVNYTDLINESRQLIKTEMSKNNIVGLSIAFVDKDGII